MPHVADPASTDLRVGLANVLAWRFHPARRGNTPVDAVFFLTILHKFS